MTDERSGDDSIGGLRSLRFLNVDPRAGGDRFVRADSIVGVDGSSKKDLVIVDSSMGADFSTGVNGSCKKDSVVADRSSDS